MALMLISASPVTFAHGTQYSRLIQVVGEHETARWNYMYPVVIQPDDMCFITQYRSGDSMKVLFVVAASIVIKLV